jgi:hypothetical protein
MTSLFPDISRGLRLVSVVALLGLGCSSSSDSDPPAASPAAVTAGRKACEKLAPAGCKEQRTLEACTASLDEALATAREQGGPCQAAIEAAITCAGNAKNAPRCSAEGDPEFAECAAEDKALETCDQVGAGGAGSGG